MAPTPSSSLMTPERKALIDEADLASSTFQQLYYEVLEKRPHTASRQYMDNAVVIWDGNPICGLDQIQKWFHNLPSFTFIIYGFDSQPMSTFAAEGQKALIIKVYGTYKTTDSPTKNFFQDFVLLAVEEKWKIVSDVFRTQHFPVANY